MGLIKSVSSGKNVIVIEFDKVREVENSLQSFLKAIGFSRAKRKNIFKGQVGLHRIDVGRRGVDDYSDTVQYIDNEHISVTIFTGANKVILVVHSDQLFGRTITNAIDRCFN